MMSLLRTSACFWFLVAAVPLLGLSDTKKSVSVAVLDFNSLGLAPGQVDEVSAAFRRCLGENPALVVFDTERMHAVMQAKGYTRQIPCTDDSCIVQLGGVLDVQYIVAANAGRVSDMHSISLWMLEVRSGHVVTTIMENFQCSYRDFIAEKLPQVATRLGHTLTMGQRGFTVRPEKKTAQWLTFSREGRALPNNKVLAIEEDRKGVMWVGLKEGGVAAYDGTAWSYYTTRDGLADDDVWSIAVDKDNNKWFGTIGGGVSMFDGKRWTTYNAKNGLGNNYISGLTVDEKGTVWCLTWDSGVLALNPATGRATAYTTRDGLVDNDVKCLIIDPAGARWFGTYNGVSCLADNRWKSYISHSTYGQYVGKGNCLMIDNYIRDIDLDAAGRLWFGTYAGASQLAGQQWRSFTVKDGLVDNDVRCIKTDAYGSLWFGTFGGVSRFDGARWTTFTKQDGLVSNDIKLIEIDHLNNKWFCTTDQGITVYTGD